MKLLIDCDPGVDDLQALLLAFSAKDVEIVGITTCGGNGSSERVFQNIVNITTFCNQKHIPVFKGPACNFMGEPHRTDSYFGCDSIGEIGLEDSIFELEHKPAAIALVEIAKKHKGEVIMVALGPMTNLACAYLLDNNIDKYFKDFYMMGTDRAEKTLMCVTDYSEFNTWVDPAAMNFVLKTFFVGSGKTIKVIDCHFCTSNLLPIDKVEVYYRAIEKELGDHLHAQLVGKCHKFMRTKFSEKGTLTADPFTMFLALNPHISYKSVKAVLKSVCFEGEQKGHTVYEFTDTGHIELIDELDFDSFFKQMFQSVGLNE